MELIVICVLIFLFVCSLTALSILYVEFNMLRIKHNRLKDERYLLSHYVKSLTETCAEHDGCRNYWCDCDSCSGAMRAERKSIYDGALEEAAKISEGGRFLHDDAPDAKLGRACAVAIRAAKTKG